MFQARTSGCSGHTSETSPPWKSHFELRGSFFSLHLKKEKRIHQRDKALGSQENGLCEQQENWNLVARLFFDEGFSTWKSKTVIVYKIFLKYNEFSHFKT